MGRSRVPCRKRDRISRLQPEQRKREAARHHAASEELAQLSLHETRQPLTAPAQARFGEKRLQVLANHLMQDGLLRLAANVGMARSAERGVVGCRKREAPKVTERFMPQRESSRLD
jgi:hypothetical protein